MSDCDAAARPIEEAPDPPRRLDDGAALPDRHPEGPDPFAPARGESVARSLADRDALDRAPEAEAPGRLDDAIARLGPLIDRHGDVWQFRTTLADALATRARIHRRAGRPGPADADAQAARESLAGSFHRIERTDFRSTDGLLAALHLHAELVLLRRMAPFEPPPVDLPSPVGSRQ